MSRPGATPGRDLSETTHSPCFSKGEEFMKAFFSVSVIALTIALTAVTSRAQQPMKMDAAPAVDAKQEAAIAANLAKLKPEDRKLAEAQKFCAIQTKNRLGGMGVPVKVMIKDKPVFLCCGSCLSKAQANPDKTLTSVADLVKANKKPEEKKADEKATPAKT
jgi:hypothetical protein